MLTRLGRWAAFLTAAALLLGAPLQASGAGGTIYLPQIQRGYNTLAAVRRVNAPYFGAADVDFSRMGIFWFGQVDPTTNYSDVRVGYNDTELVVYISPFDRRIWYDTSPAAADLTKWDGVSVYLNLGSTTSTGLTAATFRLDAQLVDNIPLGANSKATYYGPSGSWTLHAVAFTATGAWAGDHINDSTDDRGWAIDMHIPFASLGVSRPAAGAAPWGLAVQVHDRDDAAGTAIPDTVWPENANTASPATWGLLRWGLPTVAPAVKNLQTVTIQNKYLNGQPDASVVVPDADVGGAVTNQCPGDSAYIWNQWGNDNYGLATGMNVQNQDNIADWPCFAKIYLTFPLSVVPAGKVIKTATLTLHQFGGSGTASNNSPPYDEYIQVLLTGQDWSETGITWNNAPLALENFGGAWVTTVEGCGSSLPWPCQARDWDVTAAVTQAYAAGGPARLVLYSASTGISTGKYFSSSQAFDPANGWSTAVTTGGRPKLTIQYGDAGP